MLKLRTDKDLTQKDTSRSEYIYNTYLEPRKN